MLSEHMLSFPMHPHPSQPKGRTFAWSFTPAALRAVSWLLSLLLVEGLDEDTRQDEEALSSSAPLPRRPDAMVLKGATSAGGGLAWHGSKPEALSQEDCGAEPAWWRGIY